MTLILNYTKRYNKNYFTLSNVILCFWRIKSLISPMETHLAREYIREYIAQISRRPNTHMSLQPRSRIFSWEGIVEAPSPWNGGGLVTGGEGRERSLDFFFESNTLLDSCKLHFQHFTKVAVLLIAYYYLFKKWKATSVTKWFFIFRKNSFGGTCLRLGGNATFAPTPATPNVPSSNWHRPNVPIRISDLMRQFNTRVTNQSIGYLWQLLVVSMVTIIYPTTQIL